MSPVTFCTAAMGRPAVLLLLSGMILFDPFRTPARADSRGPVGIDAIREESRRLHSELAREQWDARTKGRPEKRAPLFAAHQSFLAPATLQQIQTTRAALADTAEIRALDLLELDLAGMMMQAGVAELDDDIARLMAELKADVEDYPEPLTLQELDHWIAMDPDSLRVRMLQSVRLGLWRDRLDPLFERRRTAVDSLAIAFGYAGYTEFSARLRRADPGLLLSRLFRFIRATDTMYQVLTRELTRPAGSSQPAGRGPALPPSTRDFARAEWTPEFDRYVDSSLDLVRSATGKVRADAGPPLPVVQAVMPSRTSEGGPPMVTSMADVRADVVAVDPPGDIRVAVTDLTGVAAARAALAAAGAARQRNGTAELLPEGRMVGSDFFAATAGHLYAGLVSNPEWYESRRQKDREAGLDSDIARLSDINLARLVRWRLWCDLKWIRLELASGLLTELFRHRAGTDLWMPFVFAPAGTEEREMIRQIRGFACGLPMAPEETHDALRPRPDFLGCLDDARGLAMAATLEEHLREELGPGWFQSPAAEVAPIFRAGDGWAFVGEAEQVRRLTGKEGELDFGALQRRFERLFDWSEQAVERLR